MRKLSSRLRMENAEPHTGRPSPAVVDRIMALLTEEDEVW